MRQSSVIFFFLFAAFMVYITQRGELPVYLGLLLLSPGSSQVPSTGSQASGVSASDAVKLGMEVLPYAVA